MSETQAKFITPPSKLEVFKRNGLLPLKIPMRKVKSNPIKKLAKPSILPQSKAIQKSRIDYNKRETKGLKISQDSVATLNEYDSSITSSSTLGSTGEKRREQSPLNNDLNKSKYTYRLVRH